MKQKISNQGFTLIELLVVIAIIGILSTLAIVALGSARQKSRDAKRVADLNQIGKALELYYTNNNSYPALITPGQPISDSTTTYLSSLPSNPGPRTDGGCPNQDYQYYFITATNTYVVSSCLGNTTGSFSSGPVGYHSGLGLVNCGGSIVDVDGNSYQTVQLGGQCWMAENLRTGTMVTTHQSNNGIIEKACYADSAANCLTDGGLYEWDEAMQYSSTPGVQGVCPSGWHLPTTNEFNTLEYLFTDSPTVAPYCAVGHAGYACLIAADKLKIAGKCNGRTPCGTTGLNFLLAGSRDNISLAFTSGPSSSGTTGYLWTSTPSGAAWRAFHSFVSTQSGFFENIDNKDKAFSVRCVKN